MILNKLHNYAEHIYATEIQSFKYLLKILFVKSICQKISFWDNIVQINKQTYANRMAENKDIMEQFRSLQTQ